MQRLTLRKIDVPSYDAMKKMQGIYAVSKSNLRMIKRSEIRSKMENKFLKHPKNPFKNGQNPCFAMVFHGLAIFSPWFWPCSAAPVLSPRHRRQRRGLLGRLLGAHGEAQQAALLRGEALRMK